MGAGDVSMQAASAQPPLPLLTFGLPSGSHLKRITVSALITVNSKQGGAKQMRSDSRAHTGERKLCESSQAADSPSVLLLCVAKRLLYEAESAEAGEELTVIKQTLEPAESKKTSAMDEQPASTTGTAANPPADTSAADHSLRNGSASDADLSATASDAPASSFTPAAGAAVAASASAISKQLAGVNSTATVTAAATAAATARPVQVDPSLPKLLPVKVSLFASTPPVRVLTLHHPPSTAQTSLVVLQDLAQLIQHPDGAPIDIDEFEDAHENGESCNRSERRRFMQSACLLLTPAALLSLSREALSDVESDRLR